MGAVTPLGMNVDEYWANLLAGKSGIGDMTLCDPTGYSCRIAGEVKNFDPVQYVNPKEARRMARFSNWPSPPVSWLLRTPVWTCPKKTGTRWA